MIYNLFLNLILILFFVFNSVSLKKEDSFLFSLLL